MGVEDTRDWLNKVCSRLLERDPDIVEIIQFCSSVYALKYAGVDLLIINHQEP